MIPSGGGSIVPISLDTSRQGEPREAVYRGLKATTNSFMKTIAKENGRFGIRCNCVCPGVTVPEMGETSENSMWANKGAMFTEDEHRFAITVFSNTSRHHFVIMQSGNFRVTQSQLISQDLFSVLPQYRSGPHVLAGKSAEL